jgi:Mg2+ and Co2+ transporter CorA
MNRNLIGGIYGMPVIKIAEKRRRFLEIYQSKRRIACGGHVG